MGTNYYASAEPSAACSRCPTEDGCGDPEVCRIMCMSDEEIVATTPDAERLAAEMREALREALERHAAAGGPLMGFDQKITAITRESIQRSLDTIGEALAMKFGGAVEETAWLIEFPPSPDHQPRWWHPVHGWTIDPNRALRLARREDAQALIDGSTALRGVPTEHKWLSPSSTTPKGRSGDASLNEEEG